MLLFNATHFVTAWAPVVVIAQSTAPASKNCFEIFITLIPPCTSPSIRVWGPIPAESKRWFIFGICLRVFYPRIRHFVNGIFAVFYRPFLSGFFISVKIPDFWDFLISPRAESKRGLGATRGKENMNKINKLLYMIAGWWGGGDSIPRTVWHNI